MPETITNPLETLTEVAQTLELNLSSYSGRGMYGKVCASINGKNPYAIIEEAASRGIRGARVDSLGLGSVVYWPTLEWDERYAFTQGFDEDEGYLDD